MTDGEIAAEPQPITVDYQPRLVAAALACVWFSVVAVMVAMGLIVALQGAHSSSVAVVVPVIAMLFFVQVPGAIALLVLSILAGMWRPWLDAVMSAVLLLTMVATNLMLWPLIEAQPGVGFFACSQDGCTFGPSTTDLWIGVGVQTLLLAILLVSTSHWIWRLRPDTSSQKTNRLAIAGIALVCAAILAAVDANIPTGSITTSISDSNTFSGGSASASSGPPAASAGPVLLTNDLGHTVRVVFCPRQICSGQAAHTMKAGASATFTGNGGKIPDSFVVLGDGSAPKCQTTDIPDGFGGPAGMNVQPLSSADAETCGMDVQTLTVPH